MNHNAEIQIEVGSVGDNVKRSLREIMVPTKPKVEKPEIKKDTK